MNAAVARPYTVPQSGGNGRAIALAVLVHALLGALLYFGVHWQSSTPAVVQAELWSAVPQTAAPAPRPVVVQPPPRVEPPQRVETPPEVKVERPMPKADIVERTPAKVEPPKKKPEPVKVEEPKPQPKPKPAPPPPKVEPKPRPEVQKLLQQAAVEAPARPPSELNALLASASKESTGRDQQTSGPRGRDTYIARLVTAIRSQTRYAATSPGNPDVKVRIEQLPTGEVVNVTVVKPSGVPAFDAAVERGVRAASPLPRDENGKVPERMLDLDYYMYDKP